MTKHCHKVKKCEEKYDADYIIVGLGTAGSVLARYLSDPINGRFVNKVLVLEAGQNHSLDPAVQAGQFNPNFPSLSELAYNPKYAFTKICPDTSPILGIYPNEQYSTGRGWFGSSAHNFQLAVRGSSDRWNELANTVGNDQWTYNNLLPFMKFLETYNGTSTQPQDRGNSGPLQITPFPLLAGSDLPLANALSNITGASILPDYNVPDGNITISNGQTYNTADLLTRSFGFDFLPPNILNPDGTSADGRKLLVKSGAFVSKVIFKDKKAVGVQYFLDNDKKPHVAYAKKEIILCAGCPFSAAILQRSGIGPAAVLKDPKVNIPVLVDNPFVGNNLKVHYGAIQAASLPADAVPSAMLGFVDGRPFFAPAGAGDNNRRMQLFMVGGFFEIPAGVLSAADIDPNQPGVSGLLWNLRPRSSGTAFLVDDSPFTPPDIRFNLYSDGDQTDPASDLSNTIAMYKIVNTAVNAIGGQTLYPPASHFVSDDLLAVDAGASINFSQLSMTNHYTGTCNMATDISGGVVSSADLHVFGVRHLMVADSSIYPFPETGNTAWQCYLAGLMAAKVLGFSPL